MKSDPRANSKEGQKIILTSERVVAACSPPPKDLKHQQCLRYKKPSFLKCVRTSSDGRVVRVIICSSINLLRALRPPRQTYKDECSTFSAVLKLDPESASEIKASYDANCSFPIMFLLSL
jgi:3'-phosphoadenosine 5'-phosphosulfate sulfotransferase